MLKVTGILEFFVLFFLFFPKKICSRQISQSEGPSTASTSAVPSRNAILVSNRQVSSD